MDGDDEGVVCGSEDAIEVVVGAKGRVASGRALVVGGKLKGVQCLAPRTADGQFIATAEGSAGAGYEVKVAIRGGEAETRCTCKDAAKRGGGGCKHVAALLLLRLKFLREWGLVGRAGGHPPPRGRGGERDEEDEEEDEWGGMRGRVEVRDMQGVGARGLRPIPFFIAASSSPGDGEADPARDGDGDDSDRTDPVQVGRRDVGASRHAGETPAAASSRVSLRAKGKAGAGAGAGAGERALRGVVLAANVDSTGVGATASKAATAAEGEGKGEAEAEDKVLPSRKASRGEPDDETTTSGPVTSERFTAGSGAEEGLNVLSTSKEAEGRGAAGKVALGIGSERDVDMDDEDSLSGMINELSARAQERIAERRAKRARSRGFRQQENTGRDMGVSHVDGDSLGKDDGAGPLAHVHGSAESADHECAERHRKQQRVHKPSSPPKSMLSAPGLQSETGSAPRAMETSSQSTAATAQVASRAKGLFASLLSKEISR